MYLLVSINPLWRMVWLLTASAEHCYSQATTTSPYIKGLSKMTDLPKINCQNVVFSPDLASARIARACEFFGTSVVRRVLCWALYLLGVDRTTIAQLMQIPRNTVKSFLKAIKRDGLPALEDRRRKSSSFLPPVLPPPPPVKVYRNDNNVIIDLGTEQYITIATSKPLQLRTVILSFLNNKLISTAEAAGALSLSVSQVQNLARTLDGNDADGLLDSRKGQMTDYRVGPAVKAELIQQFTVDIITQGRTSGRQLAKELQQRCQIEISERTVRYHLAQLGLPNIKKSLPQLIAAIKKNSKT